MKFIFFCFFLASVQGVYSQTEINLVDSKGRKTGLWIDSLIGYRSEHYYKAGVKNGIEKVYFLNGGLYFLGEYKNGHLIGKGFFFHDKGFLTMTINYKEFVKHKGKTYQKGFFTYYDKSGSVSESGTGLFIEGEEELGEEIRMKDWRKHSDR